jgi:hypothetical protein
MQAYLPRGKTAWVASRGTLAVPYIPFPFQPKGAVVILVAAVAGGQDVNVLLLGNFHRE